jgi:hypothetical protein
MALVKVPPSHPVRPISLVCVIGDIQKHVWVFHNILSVS